MEGQATCGSRVYVQKPRKKGTDLSPARARWKKLRDAEEQKSLLKERRKEKERYKVVRKKRERGRKSKQMKVTGNAEHVTQASLKMRKMEINASGYSACD